MNSVVIRLLAEQRKRCLATIYGAAEASPWWGDLDAAAQNRLREQIKSAVGVFYEFTRDVVKVGDEDGPPRNELALDLIRSIHAGTQDIKEKLEIQRG